MSQEHYTCEKLSTEQCVAIVANNSQGYISVNVGALPNIFPTPYVFQDNNIFIPLPADVKIRRCLSGSVIAFETGDLDQPSQYLYSVQVIGIAELLNNIQKPNPHANTVKRQPKPGFVRLVPDVITGMKIPLTTHSNRSGSGPKNRDDKVRSQRRSRPLE